jgi:FkbM family methyltransferase
MAWSRSIDPARSIRRESARRMPVKQRLKEFLYDRPWAFEGALLAQGFVRTTEGHYLRRFARVHRGRPVFFLQVGANDGVRDDKLFYFVRAYGWRGVLIEPVQYLFERLVANYAGTQGLSFENSAVSEEDGVRSFYRLRANEDGLPYWYDQIGSFHREIVLRHKAELPAIEDYLVEEKVACISMPSLIGKYRIERLDLVLIDTEGHDWEIVKALMACRRPTMLVYEHKHLGETDRSACEALLRAWGYSLTQVDANTIAEKEGTSRD